MNKYNYQIGVSKTAIYPKGIGLAYLAMGLTGESGEVADKIKKLYRDKDLLHSKSIHKDDKEAIAKELGDVLWYLTQMATELGYSLEQIMNMNYAKLMKRRETNTLGGSGDDRENISEINVEYVEFKK